MACHFEVSIEGSNRDHGFLQDVSKDPHAPTQRHEDRTQVIWSAERRNVRCLQTASDPVGCGCVRDRGSNPLTRTPQGPHFQALQRDNPKEWMNLAKERSSMDSKTASKEQLEETKHRILFWLLSAIRWVSWIALASFSRSSQEIEHGRD
jgi:hypothetical protein